MKLTKSYCLMLSLTSLLACTEPEVSVTDPVTAEPPEHGVKESLANFLNLPGKIDETYSTGQTLFIKLSLPLETPGSIEFDITSEKGTYGVHYLTEPAAVDGKVVVVLNVNDDLATFRIIPINNEVITGEFQIDAKIENTTGSIKKGNILVQRLSITDDELTNRPMGYQTSAGIWGVKRTFEYDELGRVKKVHIEESTPATRTRTESYFYDGDGNLERVNKYPEVDQVFTWTGGRLAKSESMEFGVIKSYIEFDHDQQGHVSGMKSYYLQPDGKFKVGSIIVYLYFNTGDLYKSLTYIPVDGGEPVLNSTKTYDNYLDTPNPFPIEIVPTVYAQQRLPQSYTLELSDQVLRYEFSYEFNSDGLPVSRITTGNGSEITVYRYY